MTRPFIDSLTAPDSPVTRRRRRTARRPEAEPLEGRLLLNAGDLDPAFGTDYDKNGVPDGYVTLSPYVENNKGQYSDDGAKAVQIQPDGAILVAGKSFNYGDWGLVRLGTTATGESRGDLDRDFGSGGIVLTPFASNHRYNSPTVMALESDGKIVVAGNVFYQTGSGKTRFQNPASPSSSIRFAQIRHAANSWKAWKCSPKRS